MMTFYCDCCYFTPEEEKYCEQYDCFYTCLSVRSCNSKTTRPIFTKFLCACYLTPWLGALLTALWYVRNTIFVDDVVFSYHGANGQNQAWRSIFMMFTRWWHQLDVRQLVVGRVHRNVALGEKVCYLLMSCIAWLLSMWSIFCCYQSTNQWQNGWTILQNTHCKYDG